MRSLLNLNADQCRHLTTQFGLGRLASSSPDDMRSLQKSVGKVWLASIIAMPFLGLGFNAAYLHAHFIKRCEWWWNSRCVLIFLSILVADIVIFIVTDIVNMLILKRNMKAVSSGGRGAVTNVK